MEKTNPYIKLDGLILNAIGTNVREFHELTANAGIKAESDRIAAVENARKGLYPEHSMATPGWRIIDRRLQAPRKAEKIRYTRNTGWVAMDQNGGRP